MSSAENKQLSTIQPSDMAMGVFSSASMYGEYHRIAVNLAGSTLIPKEFQGNASNVMIALNLSSRMGADPLAIMQSMYIVHGKPSFSASFIGGILEESGKFEFLEYRYQGTEGKDDYGCRIVTTVKSSGQEIHGPLITVAMAKAEGWWGKSGSKWPTLTETMLGNRAITFFARRYAGSILLGMSSTDELEDIRDVNPLEGQAPMTKTDIKDALVGDVVDVPRGTNDKTPEEKPVTTKKPAEEEKPVAAEDKKAQAEQKKKDGKADSNAPVFTADGLVGDIEAAETIDHVNEALSCTTGFSQPDQKKVMKAASAKNKELAAKNNKQG